MTDDLTSPAPADDLHDPIVCLRMPPAMIEQIDDLRGKTTRSAFLRDAAESQITKLLRKKKQ